MRLKVHSRKRQTCQLGCLFLGVDEVQTTSLFSHVKIVRRWVVFLTNLFGDEYVCVNLVLVQVEKWICRSVWVKGISQLHVNVKLYMPSLCTSSRIGLVTANLKL